MLQANVVVHLSDLIRFIQQPVVHYFKEQLGLTYTTPKNSLPTASPLPWTA